MIKDIAIIKNETNIPANTIEYITIGSSALNPIGIDQAQQQYIFAEGVIDLELQKKKDKENFKLTQEQQLQFKSALKIGAYKQLHKQGLLTNEQLISILSIIN